MGEVAFHHFPLFFFVDWCCLELVGFAVRLFGLTIFANLMKTINLNQTIEWITEKEIFVPPTP